MSCQSYQQRRPAEPRYNHRHQWATSREHGGREQRCAVGRTPVASGAPGEQRCRLNRTTRRGGLTD